jgi:hypothetical protein
MKPKFKITENDAITLFLLMLKTPESRKLANVSNLTYFCDFRKRVLVNETQTNKQEVLIELE